MFISRLHLPRVIMNSMQPLHALSHLIITLQKAQSQYQHVSLKLVQKIYKTAILKPEWE